ncbi:MAG: phosphoribosylformylglycinamidine synthase subunit PurS [Bacteroidetes bacterium]|nr:MAG: phosphoribosylformylglycinamidine synthase subunit PurS [Bacteroidota bacterium]
MKFIASIDIMPHKELLDPQGKTIAHSMKNLHLDGVQDVRMGKHIEMVVEAENQEAAHQIVDEACRKLLANLIMETYRFEVRPPDN